MTTTQAAHCVAGECPPYCMEPLTEHTPATEQVLDNYVEGMSAFYGDGGQVEYARQFDRWLAAHDREVAAEAWEEGNAMHFRPSVGPNPRNPYREQEA